MIKLVSQGTFDGFCGIYCLAHLVAIRQPGKKQQVAREAFFQMVKSLEKIGYLTAKRIASTKDDELGFTSEVIVEAFNRMTLKKRFGLQAMAFSDDKFQSSRFCKKPNLIFQTNCTVIATVSGGKHWVAIEGKKASGDYKCYDPEITCGVPRKRIKWSDGVLLGPTNVILHV